MIATAPPIPVVAEPVGLPDPSARLLTRDVTHRLKLARRIRSMRRRLAECEARLTRHPEAPVQPPTNEDSAAAARRYSWQPSKYVGVPEVARMLGCHYSTAIRMCAAGKLSGAKNFGFGERSRWMVPEGSVIEHATGCMAPVLRAGTSALPQGARP